MLATSNRVLQCAFLIIGMVVAGAAGAVDVEDTRLLSQPAISADHVAFVYAGDLWAAGRRGGGVRRLTTHAGRESNPRFSPDGRTIAFSAEYDGNTDVYLVPVAGGAPQRLTWHPGRDLVRDFTPDGTGVVFISQRSTHTSSHWQLFTVPIAGGFPRRLPIPHAFKAAWSPDGGTIAYTPLADPFRQWKNYRGGTASRIWLLDPTDDSVTQIPQPEGRCNDTDPMWIGTTVYFLSDRNGEFNLFSYDPPTGALEQLTRHQDFPVLSASAGGGAIIYEQAGYLHLFAPARRETRRLTVGVAADLIATRPRYVSDAGYVRHATLSPSGARAAFEYRGEIITVPARKGDFRNLTNSPGVHERSPAWSPDGTRIACFSDRGGEYALHVAPQDGKGEAQIFALAGAGFYADPQWSPDGEKLSFTDNSWSLYVLDLASGEQQKISSEPLYGYEKTLDSSWSPDSRWLAYTRRTATNFQQIFLYSVTDQRSYPLTDGLSDAGEPVFDASGKYLFFTASTDAGPVRQWFAQSNLDTELTNSLYLAVLAAGEPSPLARESDEEESKEDPAGDGGEKKIEVAIDFENLNHRILALPLGTAGYLRLQAGEPGKLYYLKRERGFRTVELEPVPASLCRFDLEQREEETLLAVASDFILSADGKKVLVSADDGWLIADVTGKIDPQKTRIATESIQVRIEPRVEWPQIFHEAWRLNRDYFYDPHMHGADWAALRARYAAFLPHLATRADLNRVIGWLGSELAVSHHGVGGGDHLAEPTPVPGGLLGADYEIDAGRYRFAKVYGGLNWNLQLRSPLTEPGVEVVAGEYLLAVAGEELKAAENLYRRFETTAGKIVEITVGPHPDGRGARTVKVVPIANESALRHRDWVEGNLKKVDAATAGRVAYVYVPDTFFSGYTAFKRYFFPQAHKEAIIVDERHNGGGMVADYYIDVLRRPLISYWAMRHGDDLKAPLASIQGPKVMLIDETAVSGGDLLPWMFRQLGLGTLVGKRTCGGLVGTLNFPELMDGGMVTAPDIAIWTEQGWVVENVGVPPDVEVEQLPAEVNAGHDPQLEKAIEIILEQLPPSPPPKPERPPYPVRVRQ